MSLKDAIRLRILELCRENGLTVNGLCAVAGINQSTICNIIGGRNHSTDISTIQKICDGLEIDLPVFFDSDVFQNLEKL